MQIKFTSIIAAGFVLVPAVSAFAITNCVSGAYHQYGEAGNYKCQNFYTNNKVAYDSNKGLKLTVWASTDCQGTPTWETTTQNSCINVPFQGQSVKAT